MARRPAIQNAVKKFSAPAVLLAAVGGYFIVRVAEIQSGKPVTPKTLTIVPPKDSTRAAEQQQHVEQPAAAASELTPAARLEAAAATDSILTQLRRTVPPV